MLETGRRSAISISELGLYSDRGDRYSRSRYGLIVRKFAIGVMVVVTVILVGIFLYDFTSATSGGAKTNQETKHIYILQNVLKKSPNISKKSSNYTLLPEAIVNQTDFISMQDRSDDENYEDSLQRNTTINDMISTEARIMKSNESEFRSQNLYNFKQRKRMLKSMEDDKENEENESKQLFDNHAIVYRVRKRYKHPNPDSDDDINTEDVHPTPFHWELKTPHPTSFKRPRYPQLSQYRYPQSSRNIQDIIKYLTNDAPNRGIKFTGVYVNPKKYDLVPDQMGEMMSNSDKSEEEEIPSYPIAYNNNDPFYQYKPKHPADVNLLAPSSVRFSPSGLHRYSPYYNSFYNRPLLNYNKPIITDPQYETIGAYSTHTLSKSRKPKPFSVMLDIYPITDLTEPNTKTTWTRPQVSMDDYDSKRPSPYNRGPKFYTPPSQPPIPLVAAPSQMALSEEEERQQMVLHLNLYPRKKNKLNRQDIIHKSESMRPEERLQFAKKIMLPLEAIAEHLSDHSMVEESKFEGNENLDTTNLSLTRYQDTSLDHKKEDEESPLLHNNPETDLDMNSHDDANEEEITARWNHKLNIDDDYASTEKYEIESQKIIVTTENNCTNCNGTMMTNSLKNNRNGSVDFSKDIDTVEKLQRFNDAFLQLN